jgi:putative PEP-CTERM system TPR-repeat lipoprotein
MQSNHRVTIMMQTHKTKLPKGVAPRSRTYAWKQLAIIAVFFWPRVSNATDPSGYLRDAQSYFDKGQYETAVVQLKNALVIDPDNPRARLLLAKTYLKLQDGLTAEKELLRAQELGLPREAVLPPLGRAWLMNGESEKLLKTLAPEADDPPGLQVDILVLQGRAYLANQGYALAEEKFTRALELAPQNADAQVGMAQLAVYDKDIAKAQTLVDKAIELDPRNEGAWVLKGDLLRLSGKNSEAATAYQKALDAAPGGVAARLGRAMAYLSGNEPEKALADVGQVLGRFPNYYPAQYVRALALYKQKKLVPAWESLTILFRLSPDHLPGHLLAAAIAYQQGHLNQAEEHLGVYLSSNPGDPTAEKLLAATLLKSGQAGKAIELLAPGAASASNDAQYLALLGSAYLAHGDVDKGLEVLEKAVAAAPDITNIRTQLVAGRLAKGQTAQAITELENLGELGGDAIQADVLLVTAYLQNKEYDEALKVIETLRGKMADSALPENLRGITYARMGETAPARDAYEAALKIEPDFLPAYFNLAQLDREAGDMAKAEARYRKILSFDQDNLQALLDISRLAEDTGRADESEQWLKQAYTRHPEALNAGVLLVQHYLQHDQTQKALKVSREMAVRFPNNPAVLDLLSICQFNTGQFKDALATLKRLAEVKPDSAEVFYQLAKVQLHQNQADAARESLRHALGLREDYPEAQVALGRLQLAAQEYDAALGMAERLKQVRPEAPYGDELEGDVAAARGEARQAATAYALAYEKGATAALAQKLFYVRMKIAEDETAYETLRHWLADHPEDTATRQILASALQSAGDNQQTIEEYRKVLEADPDNLAALNNIAWLYQETGSPEGIHYAERAHDLAPDKPEITDTLGWLLVQNGDVNRGLVLLQEARVKAPHIPDIHYHMAVALYKSGRVTEARKELDRLLKTGRTFPDRDNARALLDQLANQ